MKNVILAVGGSILLLVVGFLGLRTEEGEPEAPAPEVVVTYQAPPMTEQQRQEWTRQAYEQLTPEHRLHLSAEEQDVFQACLVQRLRAAHAVEVTQAPEAQADWQRWEAEVQRWEAQARAAAEADVAIP